VEDEIQRLDDDLRRMASAYFRGRNLALLFDFDGTLAPLVIHPDLATCSDSTRQVLASLAQLPRVTVGIISARAISDLKSKISIPKLIYAGTCGLELELGGRTIENAKAKRNAPLMLAVAELVTSAVNDFRGAWIEQKPLAFTIHYRQVSRDDVPFLKQSLANTLSRFEGTLVSFDGSMATEVLPDVGWTKGNALDYVMQQCGRDAIPLYAGNDVNDADAMEAALAYGGVTIGIGPLAPSSARFSLPDVESMTECLGCLLSLLQNPQQLANGDA
jgi:trehalose-phosphatase